MAEDSKIVIIQEKNIQSMIYTLRGKQVMLDRDLAVLYDVKSIRLREQVKRNIERFPDDFMFRLTNDEVDYMVSQNAIPSKQHLGGSLPYVFTEQGIAMLSSVLKSETAAKISIRIMRTFVEIRRFLVYNGELFSRLDRVELKQIETDKKLEEVFKYISSNNEVKQHIFFHGQIYDAYSFIVDLIQKSKEKIILIDNYVDINTLNILSKKNEHVDALIVTAGKGNLNKKDIQKFNSQYPKLTVKKMINFHDRFLIIDDREVYHIGASIKDAGKKSFGITKIEDNDLIKSLIDKVK